MKEFLDKYADLIVHSFLKLQKDDLLSLNIEERDMDFARVIADKAMALTDNVVKLVITENGKVSDVIDFEPDHPYAQGKMPVMLHIAHQIDRKPEEGTLLRTIVQKDDFPAIQKCGHLADPQILGRRIAVPWCTVNLYDSNSQSEKKLEELCSSDVDNAVLATDYRCQFLNHSDVHKMEFKSENSDFSFEVPEDDLFISGVHKLQNGRKFVSSENFEKIIIPIVKQSFNGRFEASFEVFGRNCKGNFIFENGKLKEYPSSPEMDMLLGFDENMKYIGFMEASDKDFELVLGGSNVETLNDDNKELPEYFNECNYLIRLKIDEKPDAAFENCKGERKEIIRKGYFLE